MTCSRPCVRVSALVSAWGLTLAMGLLVGCNGTPAGSQYPAGSAMRQANIPGRFTIVLAQYGQYDRVALAKALQTRAKRALRTDDIWLHNDEKWLNVNYGHFAGQEEAERAFKTIQKSYPSLNAGAMQFCFVREIVQPRPAGAARVAATRVRLLLQPGSGHILQCPRRQLL